ncbi:uncharacterized protein LOC119550573 [Drosophila subpulchrella]|uniref:uncharacterized protein LOC119550573 n=1 Tax=Drosophila subpulchrella TaxID=1486046 RepID=UPI0018A1A9DB|nr:uncharacterized protein LOC119550573 [Drosophila subpulchrella]
MPLNWYLLKTTGSMTRVNTYIRKFTEGSERSGVLSTAPKVAKKKSTSFKISELDRISYLSSSSRRSRGISNRSGQLKEPKSPQIMETCPLKSNSIPKKEPVVQDSPRMREFFNEVRQRELKNYYLQMKAAQRVPVLSHLCSDCGLPKRDRKDLTQNIYCTGDENLRRSKTRCGDRYKDLTWLWNSSLVYPNSGMSCGCRRSVSNHV